MQGKKHLTCLAIILIFMVVFIVSCAFCQDFIVFLVGAGLINCLLLTMILYFIGIRYKQEGCAKGLTGFISNWINIGIFAFTLIELIFDEICTSPVFLVALIGYFGISLYNLILLNFYMVQICKRGGFDDENQKRAELLKPDHYIWIDGD